MNLCGETLNITLPSGCIVNFIVRRILNFNDYIGTELKS